MIAKADIRRVQEWMGQADVQTTMKYLHYAPGEDDAALVAEVFRTQPIAERTSPRLTRQRLARRPTEVRRPRRAPRAARPRACPC